MFRLTALLLLVLAAPQDPDDWEARRLSRRPTHGPVLGHVSPRTATVWYRVPRPGTYQVLLEPALPEHPRGFEATADDSGDGTLSFEVSGLQPDTEYQVYLASIEEGLYLGGATTLRTPPLEEARARVVFGSCADERRFPEHGVWNAIAAREPSAVVLLGDTPYIDSTDLDHQRRRYQEFLQTPDLAELLRVTPAYWTWDDHDFGRNDTDGNLEGRENSRQAFVEYHAGDAWGEQGQGIYSSFRRGPVEVFLIDARWFAGREDSVAAPGTKSLVGAQQWAWLTRALQASDAPFKVLATGMIWNGATRPGKRDHWATYARERDALFAFLGEHEIEGVVLVGGDIHRSRAVVHDTQAAAGYPLTELITSPMANTIILAANAPHPGLAWDAGLMHTFLELDATTEGEVPALTARFRTQDGEVHHTVHLTADQLRKAPAAPR